MGKILVTGGTGYLGTHMLVELVKQGYEPLCVDNLHNSNPSVLLAVKEICGKEIPFIKADAGDVAAMRALFAEYQIDAVIHFAGLKAVGESCRIPLAYYRNNLDSTLTLMEVMEEFGCKKLVFSSSATVYGPENPVPYVESMPAHLATNPYGWTKIMIEQILSDYTAANPDFSAVLLRYFNPIGAHESGLLGEDPNGIPNNLMPYIAKVAVGKLEKVHVFGNDYPTPDGTGVRDYIHVVDLARGHVCAIRKLETNCGLFICNLGTGKGYSVLDVVKAFEKASGLKINYRIAPRRAGDVACCYADATKAKEVLSWQAKYDIDDMCADSWRWQSQNPNGLE